MINEQMYMLMDPMALIIPPKLYPYWWDIHNPPAPKADEIRKLFSAMEPEERKAAILRARRLAEYAKAVEEATAAVKA